MQLRDFQPPLRHSTVTAVGGMSTPAAQGAGQQSALGRAQHTPQAALLWAQCAGRTPGSPVGLGAEGGGGMAPPWGHCDQDPRT